VKRNVLVVLFVACLAGRASAGPITFTETFTGTGALGGNAYTNALVTLTLVGDTSNVLGADIFTLAGLGSVEVSGLGVATLTGDIRAVANQPSSRAGISDFAVGRAILFTDNPAFATYDLMSPIGPLTGPPAFNSGFTFATNVAGGFRIDTVAGGGSTFAARVPEPSTSSLALIGAGLLGLIRKGRRIDRHQ
jgi:hypothetical protein